MSINYKFQTNNIQWTLLAHRSLFIGLEDNNKHKSPELKKIVTSSATWQGLRLKPDWAKTKYSLKMKCTHWHKCSVIKDSHVRKDTEAWELILWKQRLRRFEKRIKRWLSSWKFWVLFQKTHKAATNWLNYSCKWYNPLLGFYGHCTILYRNIHEGKTHIQIK